MSYKLYYAEPSAAMGARVILEEIGSPYELVWTDISQNSTRKPDLLDLNPNGWIPVLVWEEGAIYECGAMTFFSVTATPRFSWRPEQPILTEACFCNGCSFSPVLCKMLTR